MTDSTFQQLREVNIQSFVEKKGMLSYLSWAKAWDILKKQYPNAQYTIYENEQGFPYFTDGKWVWVKVGVTVNELEHKMILPVMNLKNQALQLENADMTVINKTIMRCLTKAIAMHGVGLSLYIGEDLEDNSTNNTINNNYNTKRTYYSH